MYSVISSVIATHLLAKRIGYPSAELKPFEPLNQLARQSLAHMSTHFPVELGTVMDLIPNLGGQFACRGISIDLAYIHGSSLIITQPNDIDIVLKVAQHPYRGQNGQVYTPTAPQMFRDMMHAILATLNRDALPDAVIGPQHKPDPTYLTFEIRLPGLKPINLTITTAPTPYSHANTDSLALGVIPPHVSQHPLSGNPIAVPAKFYVYDKWAAPHTASGRAAMQIQTLHQGGHYSPQAGNHFSLLHYVALKARGARLDTSAAEFCQMATALAAQRDDIVAKKIGQYREKCTYDQFAFDRALALEFQTHSPVLNVETLAPLKRLSAIIDRQKEILPEAKHAILQATQPERGFRPVTPKPEPAESSVSPETNVSKADFRDSGIGPSPQVEAPKEAELGTESAPEKPKKRRKKKKNKVASAAASGNTPQEQPAAAVAFDKMLSELNIDKQQIKFQESVKNFAVELGMSEDVVQDCHNAGQVLDRLVAHYGITLPKSKKRNAIPKQLPVLSAIVGRSASKPGAILATLKWMKEWQPSMEITATTQLKVETENGETSLSLLESLALYLSQVQPEDVDQHYAAQLDALIAYLIEDLGADLFTPNKQIGTSFFMFSMMQNNGPVLVAISSYYDDQFKEKISHPCAGDTPLTFATKICPPDDPNPHLVNLLSFGADPSVGVVSPNGSENPLLLAVSDQKMNAFVAILLHALMEDSFKVPQLLKMFKLLEVKGMLDDYHLMLNEYLDTASSHLKKPPKSPDESLKRQIMQRNGLLPKDSTTVVV